MAIEWVQLNLTTTVTANINGSGYYLNYGGYILFDPNSFSYPYRFDTGEQVAFYLGTNLSNAVDGDYVTNATIGPVYTDAQFQSLIASGAIGNGHFEGAQFTQAEGESGVGPLNYYLGDLGTAGSPGSGQTVTFVGSLDGFSFGSHSATFVTQAWAEINVPDTTPSISIAANVPTVYETPSGTEQATFTVSLSAASQDTITVQYATQDVTAKAGTDYKATSGTLAFAPGQTTATISVPVIGHSLPGPNATFSVGLTNPVDTSNSSNTPSIANGTGTETIDYATVSIITDSTNTGTASASSSAGLVPISFTVELNQPVTEGTLVVDLIPNASTVGLASPLSLPLYKNSEFNTDWQLTAPSGRPNNQITFTAGDGLSKTFTAYVDPQTPITPTEYFTLGVQVDSASNTPDQSYTLGAASVVEGVINSSQPLQHIVDSTISSAISPTIAQYLQQDLEAAADRISQALVNAGLSPLKHLSVNVVSDLNIGTINPETGFFAIASTQASLVSGQLNSQAPQAGSFNVPSALYEYVKGSLPNQNSGPEITISVNPLLLGSYLDGSADSTDLSTSPHNAVDFTTILTHELLHGLGVINSKLSTPWELLTINSGAQFDGSHAVQVFGGPVPLGINGHVGTSPAFSGDLMQANYVGPHTPVSTLDVAMFEDVAAYVAKYFVFPSGSVINHYISGATVFADANGNGQLDSGEASTTTDSTGSFTLTGGSGPLIAFGGTDISTGLAFKGPLSAPDGSSVITPLTTLLTNLSSDPSAEQKVLSNLGLSSTLDLTTFDPIAAAQGGSADGAATEIAGEKVYDTVEMIASALMGVGATFTPSLQAAFFSLASALDGAGVNLSDKTALSTLFTQVAHTEGITLGQGVADTIATVIAAGNAALDHVLQTDQPGTQLLSDAAGVELVEQGAVSTALTNAAGNSSQLQSLANLFTGTNLNTLITQAQTETQNPGQDLGPIAFNGTATTDQNAVLDGTVSAIDLAGHSVTYALDGSAPAGLTFNSDGTFSFDPGTNYKYLALGESTTLSFKFDASDGQGTPSTGTEAITINGLNDPPTIDSAHTTASGTINELPHTTGSNSIDKARGVISFSDPDLSDRPTATIDTKDETFSYQDSAGHTYSLTPAQIAAFEAAISIQPETGNTNTGKIDWVFSFADKHIDFLGAGESVTATIPVVIDDHNGGTVTQDVVVTIDGANDNPVAAPDSDGVAFGRTLKVAADKGVLANDYDPDIHDTLTVEAVDGKTKAVGHAIDGEYGSLTLNADGSYSYKANYDDDHGRWNDGRWDHGGGVKQDTFTYTVSDGHGSLTTSTLNIVVFEKGTTYLSGANTTLAAGKGPYVLDGSAGGDTLVAGKGDAVLIGGDGDTLVAGKGQDTFLFRSDFGSDTIKNFNVHEDTLQFDQGIFKNVHDIWAHTTNTPAGAVISDGHGDSVTLLGVTSAQLHHEGFHLLT